MESTSNDTHLQLHGLNLGPFPEPTSPIDATPTTVTSSATFASSNSSSILDIPERTSVRLASAFVIFFVLGWGDGVTGTLLPHFKADFHLSFMTSSLCFVASTIGFGFGTALVERLLNVAGRIYFHSGKVMLPTISQTFKNVRIQNNEPIVGYSPSLARYVVVFGATLLHPIFFVIMGCRRNFPSMLVAYIISAFARSLLSATMNFYCASTSKRALGYMYGYWSIGSMCAPLVCQSIIAKGVAWNHFYFGSLVLSAISSVFAFFAFRPTPRELESDSTVALMSVHKHETTEARFQKPATTTVDEANLAEIKDSITPLRASHGLGRALRLRIVWAFAIFCCLYTGTEASTQGFIVTYLLNVRNANPKVVGYATSGFWGGLAIGRFTWGYFTTRLSFKQRKYVIHACMCLALTMHVLIWFVRSFVENAFSTALVGLAYGPIYPGNMGQADEVFPEELRMIAMAIMGAFGSFGAALFPFLTGTLSNLKGPQTFTYVVVSLTASLLCMWYLLPSSAPTRKSSQ